MKRRNLSEELGDVIRKMIFEGSLAAGERINEVHLAERLGVSRTPLRECLAALVVEGALEIEPRKGFFVRALTAQEARAIYSIRAILDPEALLLSGIPSPDQIKEVTKINKALHLATKAEEAIALDDKWHLSLYSNCPNPELLNLIRQYMVKTRRYEFASMRERSSLDSSFSSKREIVEHLKRGELKKACSRLKKSLSSGVIPVIEWLGRKDSDKQSQ